jgi:hypothetical protein
MEENKVEVLESTPEKPSNPVTPDVKVDAIKDK